MRFVPRLLRPRRGSGPPEAPLWDHLDACGLDFRAPMSQLIAIHGSYPIGWTPDLDICIPATAAPFLPQVDHPPRFQFNAQTDLSIAPGYFNAAVQGDGDHRLNYARAIKALSDRFGPGEYAGNSNTSGRIWQFGLAWLRCTVFPPDLQNDLGHNMRHEMFPKTRTEAAITFKPAWRMPLSEVEIASLATAQPLPISGTCPAPPGSQGNTALTRDWPGDLDRLPAGPALSDDHVMLVHETAHVDMVPRAWVTGLVHTRATQGRSGAAAHLALRYRPSGQTTIAQHNLALASLTGHADGLDKAAETLSQTLSLPIELYEGPSD